MVGGGAGHDGGGPFPGMRDAEVGGRLGPGQPPGRGGANSAVLGALVVGVLGIAAAFVAAGFALVVGVIGGALALWARGRVAARREGSAVLAWAAVGCNAAAVVLAIVLLVR